MSSTTKLIRTLPHRPYKLSNSNWSLLPIKLAVQYAQLREIESMQLPSDPTICSHLAALYNTLLQQNLLRIIATDPGEDDTLATLLAIASPELEIIGCTVSFSSEYDSRYAHARPADTTAPPILIQLFNPAFAYFSSKVFDPEYAVPDEILRDVQKLRTKFAAIHANENEFCVTSSIESPVVGITQNGLAESIHTPSNSADQTMTILSSPTSLHIPTPEEEVILAHLALVGKNRAILSHDGPNHSTILPQFTPTPIRGFPRVHMSHSTQIFNHLDNKVLLAWFQVEHPKFMIRVFDHTGKDVFERAAVITEHV
ncbi:hypothetical protein EV424DRAFT_1545903 [Suillus variegatus]|nr:hypothetical protein EV424DRAFT_1545903 [Suillus variegatus]